MQKYAILLGYFETQLPIIEKLYNEVVTVDLSVYANRYLFAMKVQQLYTAFENFFKQIAKSFENHIENLNTFHKEMLVRMNTEIPKIRPAVISDKSLLLLDKLRAFRHFIRHAYDCDLKEEELVIIQERLKKEYFHVKTDLEKFRLFIKSLS